MSTRNVAYLAFVEHSEQTALKDDPSDPREWGWFEICVDGETTAHETDEGALKMARALGATHILDPHMTRPFPIDAALGKIARLKSEYDGRETCIYSLGVDGRKSEHETYEEAQKRARALGATHFYWPEMDGEPYPVNDPPY